jgi:hypothetical protein
MMTDGKIPKQLEKFCPSNPFFILKLLKFYTEMKGVLETSKPECHEVNVSALIKF